MMLFRSKVDLLNKINRSKGALGLVPTMGGIHEGHLSLIRKAIFENSSVIVSVFINPIQFDDPSDLKNYPKDLKADIKFISKISDDIIIYAPHQKDVYGNKIEIKEYNLKKLDKVMEGNKRKNHFNGVATIIEFLFKTFNPDNAYFGEKDYQQIQIIRLLKTTLSLSTKIIQCPTIRDKDGLALSSRNSNLTPHHREIAPKIYKCLIDVQKMSKGNSYSEIFDWVNFNFSKIKECNLEYFTICNPKTLAEISPKDSPCGNRAFIAVKLGGTRLIDNIGLC